MPFWELFYHFIWCTKDRDAWIQGRVEPYLYQFIRAKVLGLGGTVLALGGTEDHVHLVATVPPQLAIASFVGQVKGASSRRLNGLALFPEPVRWQPEYGVFSLSRRNLPIVCQYVANQKRHHREGTLFGALEI